METYPTWIRLHPDAVDDTLATSVQARIHDPLWMLGRQWQFGELRHDAGATPIDIRVEGTTAPLARLRGGAASTTGASLAIKPLSSPLETLVEREAVQETALDNLRLRIESGLHLARMLRAAALGTRVAFWIQQAPFAIPDLSLLDDESREWFELADGRVPDGGKLAAAIRAQLAPATTPPIAEAEATVLRAWLTWASARFDAPGGGPSTWDATHMEYSFSVAGRGATEEVLLAAPEYLEGRLDWYAFEQATGSLGVTGQATPRQSFRIPAPLDFAGMPNPRFWTFEDPSVRFDILDVLSQPDASPSPATLMVLDFALSYSDDWFLVPMALDAWTLFEATAVAVTDVFGDVAIANPPAGRWNMFRLDTTANPPALSRLYMVAGPAQAIEGPALEEVHFLPDEVANVAWAVERVVPRNLGRGRNPHRPAGLGARQHAVGSRVDAAAACAARKLVSAAACDDRTARARCAVVSARPAPRRAVAHRAAQSASAASSRGSAGRGCPGVAPLAVGEGHRRVAPFLDRPKQDAAPDRHRTRNSF